MLTINPRRVGIKAALAGLGLFAGIAVIAGCSQDKPNSTASGDKPAAQTTAGPGKSDSGGKKKRIVFVFKSGGGGYSDACKRGAEQANSDPSLNVQVDYEASAQGTAEKQVDIVEQAIVSHADAIVVSPVDSKAIVPSINKAEAAGIKVFTWDADAPDSKREFYFAAVDDVKIGEDIGESLAKSMGGKGKVLIFSGQSTAENLNSHVKGVENALKKYSGITIATPYIYNDDAADKAAQKAVQALQKDPDATGIACVNAPSPPAAAEAVRKNPALKGKVKIWGLSLPSMCSTYLKDDTVTGLYLWDPQKLTYTTAMFVKQVLDGKPLKTGGPSGADGSITVNGAIVTLPLRLEINKGNVDSLKF